MKGKLKTVSKTKGLKIKDQWFNPCNTIKESYTIDHLKSLIGKDVVLNLNDKNYYTFVAEFKEVEDKPRVYTKIEAFEEFDILKLKDKLNNFARENKVKATQTHITGHKVVAFVYYEVKE